MSRWKAAAIHLALSALILGTLAVLLIWRWYPPALVELTGADTVLLLIACVDLVVGPLLTLMVYRHGKKGMKFDLTVIALLQVAAMLYGLNAAWQTRPVFLVASDTRLTLVTANELSAAVRRDAPPAYRRLPAFGPRTVAVLMPDGNAESLLAVARPRLPSQYRPYAEMKDRLRRNAMPVDALAATLDARERARLEVAVRRTGQDRASLGAVPVRSIRGRATMLLELRTGALLGPVAVHMPEARTAKAAPAGAGIPSGTRQPDA